MSMTRFQQLKRFLLNSLLGIPILWCALFMSVWGFSVANGMPPAQACEINCRPGIADYHAVMDALFPREWHENSYTVLRYEPTSEPEQQIVILRKENGSYEIHHYSLP